MARRKAKPPGAPLIELRDVTKVYGEGEAEVRALDGIDLRIDEGEFAAVMGPSGSGKSTAMNIIGCLDRPTSGSYLFNGVEVGGLDRKQRARLRRNYLGFVFQGFNLLARTSAVENVELPLIYRGMKLAERRPLAMDALARVGLARAIVTEPSVLLADEPTGNLDTKTSHEIMELLVGLNREQKITVLMVTHEPEMVAYAGRVVHFLDGKIASDTQQQGACLLYTSPSPRDG